MQFVKLERKCKAFRQKCTALPDLSEDDTKDSTVPGKLASIITLKKKNTAQNIAKHCTDWLATFTVVAVDYV